MFDIKIIGGTVVDGTGEAGRRADVGITGDRIEAIGDLSQAEAGRIIDAEGLTLSPGFIDTHVHSDAALLTDPQHPEGILQGITTEILGQDGLSYCPLSADNYKVYGRYLRGILGDPPEGLDASSVATFREAYRGTTAVNTAYLIAHGALRLETCGFSDVPMTGDRLEHAQRLVREGMEQGAVGLATGLSYHPQAWSDTTELVEICRPVAEAGGVYVTHLRDVNTDRAFGEGGVPEALEVGRRSGVKVHFSHYRTATHNAGDVAESLRRDRRGRGRGEHLRRPLPVPDGQYIPRQQPAELRPPGRPGRHHRATQGPGGDAEARRAHRGQHEAAAHRGGPVLPAQPPRSSREW